MPSTSKAQAGAMAAAAHNAEVAKKMGIPQSVAREYNQADKGGSLLKSAMRDQARRRKHGNRT